MFISLLKVIDKQSKNEKIENLNEMRNFDKFQQKN